MAKTNWKHVEGTVVSVASIYPRGRLQLIVKFSYEVHGENYESELYTFKSMHRGDPLDVKYDPSNPKLTAFEVAYSRTWRLWWIVMGTVLAGALIVMLWITSGLH